MTARRLVLLGAAAVLAVSGCAGSGDSTLPLPVTATGSPGASSSSVPVATTPPVRAPSSPASTSSPSPVPPPIPLPPTAPPASPPTLQLGGANLVVTQLGAPYAEAKAAISSALGPPSADPYSGFLCLGAQSETAWEAYGFFTVERDGTLYGWVANSDRLQTPSGVQVGTDIPTLERVYGDALRINPPNPDRPSTFSLTTADVMGNLSSTAPEARVTSLYSGSCAGP